MFPVVAVFMQQTATYRRKSSNPFLLDPPAVRHTQTLKAKHAHLLSLVKTSSISAQDCCYDHCHETKDNGKVKSSIQHIIGAYQKYSKRNKKQAYFIVTAVRAFKSPAVSF